VNGRFFWQSASLLLLSVLASFPPAQAAAPLLPPEQSRPRPLSSSNTALNSQWTPVGPSQIITSQYGPVTGRVSALAVDPSDPTGNTVYLGATGGGVWKSTNAAGRAASVTFTPTTDSIPGENYTTSDLGSLTIGALSVQPNPSSGILPVILAGTGDPNDATDSYYGDGILRSTDGGNSWTLIAHSSDNQFGPGQDWSFFGLSFSGFAWSTTSPNLVVAAVSSALESQFVNAGYGGDAMMGLYYSVDAGITWRLAVIADGPNQTIQSPIIDFGSGFTGSPATSVIWNPFRRVFIAGIRRHGYYQSTDGVNWTRLANQPGPGLNATNCPALPGSPGAASCPIFRGALAFQPATGDTFALTTDLSNRDTGLFQDICISVNGACTTPLAFANQLPSAALEAGSGSTVIPRADYNLSLAAIPQPNDTLLFAGTQDIYRCSLGAGCSWRNATNTNTCAAAQVSPAQHAIAWVPGTSILFFGNDGGLWRSPDLVNQQQAPCDPDDSAHFDNLNPAVGAASTGSIAELTNFAQDSTSPTTLLASAAQNGTALANAPSAPWQQALPISAAYTAIDAANPQNWYATSGPGVSISLCTQGSNCAPADFQPAITEAQVANDGLALIFSAVFTLDSADSKNLLVGTCRIWRVAANGSASTAISPMLDGDNAPACQSGSSANAQIRSLAASGTLAGQSDNAERIYAGMAGYMDGGGTAAGHLYTALVTPTSIASTTTWSDISKSPVINNYFGDPFNPGRFAVSAVAIDPHDPTGQTIYAGIAGFSGQGMMEFTSEPVLYASTDAGQHWTNITANLPAAPLNSLAIDPNDPEILYAGTDVGVYVTTTVSQCSAGGSMCWNVYGTGLPAAPVRQLLPYTGSGQTLLRAATYGRGMWQIGLASQSQTQGNTATATLAPVSLNFAPIPIQTTSPYQSVTLTNTGSADLQIGQITITGAFLQQNGCPAALSANQTCTIQVAFAPTSSGPSGGTLTVLANVAGGQLTASLSGQGTSAAAVILTPSRMTFASTLVGSQSPTQYLTVANTGGTSISLQTPTLAGPFLLTVNTCAATLPTDTSCTVGIAFAPIVDGSAVGQFSITDDVGTQTAPLLGTGTTGPTDILSPLALTFATQSIGTTSAPQSVTLTNNGDTALTLIQGAITANFAVNNLCGASLAPHSTCALQVTFNPSAVGPVTGELVVQDELHSQTVLLNGSGIAPGGSVGLTPSVLNFGPEGVNASSAPQTVTLTNNSSAPISSPTAQITGDFALNDNTCTAALAPGDRCTLQVLFHPETTGPRAGVLTLSSASLSNPAASQLNGSGMDFRVAVDGSSSQIVVAGNTATYLLQIIPVGQSSGAVSLTCAGAPTSSQCTLNPSSVTLAPGVTSTVTVTIATGAAAPAANLRAFHVAGLTVASLLPLSLGFRRRLRLFSLLFCAAALATTGCGVAITGGSGSGPSIASVGAGNYTLTIAAAAPGVQHAVTLSLTVE
jgi:hypothetical protein